MQSGAVAWPAWRAAPPSFRLRNAVARKQKLRRIYGVLERQFLNYYKKAASGKGSTGENLLKLLECRLDNVVYRMGFGSTRRSSPVGFPPGDYRQRPAVNIPSYQVRPEDVVAIHEKVAIRPAFSTPTTGSRSWFCGLGRSGCQQDEQGVQADSRSWRFATGYQRIPGCRAVLK